MFNVCLTGVILLITGVASQEFISYGLPFPALHASAKPHPNTTRETTTLTICQLWENDSIPITPAIDIALRQMRPHFDLLGVKFEVIKKTIPAGCEDDTVLEAAPALVDLHLKESEGGCALLVGPSCTESMNGVRSLAMNWNIPVMTSGASGIRMNDRLKTPILTRFGYTQEDVSLFLIRVLDRFEWKNHVLIHDEGSYSSDFASAYRRVLRSTRMDLFQHLEVITLVASDNATWSRYLEEQLIAASEKARVFIIPTLPSMVHQILLAADRVDMLTPEYVFITTNLIETMTHGFSDLAFYDDEAKRNPSSLRIFDSLLVIRMKMPADSLVGKDDYDRFADEVKFISRSSYGYVYAPGQQVTHLVLGIWDALMFYGLALNRSLSEGRDIKNGRDLTRNVWGHSFMGVAIECTVSKYGDRNFPYYVLDLNAEKRQFVPVLELNNKQQTLQEVHPIIWPGGHGPPPNEPFCGYTGKHSQCVGKTDFPAYGVPIIIVVSLLVLIAVIGFAFNRIKRIVSDDSWRVKSNEVILKSKDQKLLSVDQMVRGSQNNGALSNLSSNKSESMVSGTGFAPTAYFREMVVAIKKIQDSGVVHVPTELVGELRNLKQMMHENVARFHGLCPEADMLCILSEYCTKGSLTDLIDYDSIKLDWAFKFSLLNDITTGIHFIHRSAFKSHGRLNANNCLIDSRFVVKIGDLGLTVLRPSAETLSNTTPLAELSPELLQPLLWRAPELLRRPVPPNGTPKGDIYSLAILLQQIIERAGPFEHGPGGGHQLLIYAEILERVRHTQVPPYRPIVPFDGCPPELYNLMLKCWVETPEERPDMDKVRSTLMHVPGNKSTNLMDGLLQRMEKYAKDLESLVGERTAAFMEEKRRSEELLYQMLPRLVADKLKNGLFVQPESFDCVTIYFSDIVGFTTLSANSSPMQIVDLLNDLYTCFDEIIGNYDVYKVETIGDGYVVSSMNVLYVTKVLRWMDYSSSPDHVLAGIAHAVASGLPERNEYRHAVEIARMSVSIIHAIGNFKIKHRPGEKLASRIGAHSGPCAAGVVGLKMPRFCIFGDTVNVASRLESTGQAMKIQISSATRELLSGYKEFEFEHRGEVDLKGRGTMSTYWLKSASQT